MTPNPSIEPKGNGVPPLSPAHEVKKLRELRGQSALTPALTPLPGEWPMSIEIAPDVLLWCAAINYGVLLWWFLFFNFAHDWMHRLHGRWFRLSASTPSGDL